MDSNPSFQSAKTPMQTGMAHPLFTRIVALSQILSNHPEYQAFLNFVRDRVTNVPNDQLVRHTVVGNARKMLLMQCRKWVSEGSLTPNHVPLLRTVADAITDKKSYYDLSSDHKFIDAMELQALGPRPGVTLAILKKLAYLEHMPFLQGWVKKGLMGPFTAEHVNQTDTNFLATFRSILSERITGAKNDIHDSDLIACVSYMHTTPASEDEEVPPTKKMAQGDVARLKILIKAYMEAHSASRVFVWMDQACKGSRAESEFDWLSEGLMPYAVLPVLKVSGRSEATDVCGRLWLKVELTLGMSGSGVWWCDDTGRVSHLYNVSEHLPSPGAALAAVCRAVLAGYTDDLSSYWKDDFLRLQIWSFRILSKDRGAERTKEYEKSASIKYKGHIQVSAGELTKVMLEVATQPQFNPYTAEARQKAREGVRHSAWSDLLPMVEIDEPRREDRVYYCLRQGQFPMVYRYLTVNTEKGKKYVAMPLTETPCGEIVVGDFGKDGRPAGNVKVNLNGFSDFVSVIALQVELARLSGMGEGERRVLCARVVEELDQMFLSALVKSGNFPQYAHDSIRKVPWSEVFETW